MSRVTDLFERARQSLAGGISSSTRVNRALGHPLYFDKADGCRVWDLDGKEYLDLCCSHGATLLGHGDSRIREAIERALARGAACSYENELQCEFAELLCRVVPCCERVRFTGSGTEATMHCLRLARAYTGRPKIVKIEGHFHGYHDQVMYAIGTPADRLGPETAPAVLPASSGMPPGLDQNLIVVPYNRADILKRVFEQHGSDVAALICEPVYYNAGCVLPTAEFLEAMVRSTRSAGALLVFDEVLSAFRMGPGGAQAYLGITPDLCTLGKAVGGSLPLSVFGGRREVMAGLMPEGTCQHSGTYNAHPLSVAAGLAAVRAYCEPGFYEHVQAIAGRLYGGLQQILDRHGVAGLVQGLGARFGIYFGIRDEVRSYRDAVRHDPSRMLRFVAAATRNGVYFHDYGGAACHHGFCAAMTLADADEVLNRLETTVSSIRDTLPSS